MLNCGAIISRTGHASGGAAFASQSINVRRRVSALATSNSQKCHLLDARIGQLEKCNVKSISTCSLVVKYVNFGRTRLLYEKNVSIGLRAGCSSCATTSKTQPVADGAIAEPDFTRKLPESVNLANVFGEETGETNHKTHAHKPHELKLQDIEKMYPHAKSKVNDIYVSVGGQLKLPTKPMTIEFINPTGHKRYYTCCYKLEWPEKITISGTGGTKMSSSKLAALKCLLYLHNGGKLKNGFPIVYESQTIRDMLNKPEVLRVDSEAMKNVEMLVERYNKEVREIVCNVNEQESMRDVSLKTDNPVNPVGRAALEDWQPEQIQKSDELLQKRYFSRSMKKRSYELPIDQYRAEIIKTIENNRVLLIKGDTGCGKTTQVPQFIMDSFAMRGIASKCNMIVSQPRRISATSLAERMAEERGEPIGDTVGYQVRLQQNLPQTPSGTLFCTTGILLKKLQSNPSLKGCSHVVLDEAHERSINTDMLLVLLKRALAANPELKVVVMSATINADLFQKYFDCGVIEVPGRTYPVEMNFLEDVEKLGIRATKQYVGDAEFPEVPSIDYEQISNLICWIAKRKPPGAILCFLPGWSEISKVKKLVEERRGRGARDIIVPVHSRMSYHDQRKIFEHPPEGVRKIVLATDIAETGITVTDVVYVVDSATQKAMRFHEKKCFTTFDNQFASQANILQRKGRAGRVQSGTSYHMIPRAQFESLPPHPLPEVLRSSLEKTVLDCKTYSDEKAESFLGSMPQPPTLSAVRKALSDLTELGAIDEHENLTPLGKRIALFTVHPKLSKALVYSSIFQCVSPMVTIATAMSAESEIFSGALHDKETIRHLKARYHPSSDHLSIRWIFAQWATINRRGREAVQRFCWETKLFPERVYTLSKMRDLHADNLAQCGMIDSFDEYDRSNGSYNKYSELDELVRGVLLSGLDQLLYRRDFDMRKNAIKKGTNVFIMGDGSRATVTQECVNFKRKSWPSPFMTYVRGQHSEERRSSLIRETSMVSPLTTLLFSQGRVNGFELPQSPGQSEETQAREIMLMIAGRKNVKIACNVEDARLLLKLRDSMWKVVRYLVERHGLVASEPGTDLNIVETYKQEMLQVLSKMLSKAAEKIDTPEVQAKKRNRFYDDDDEWS